MPISTTIRRLDDGIYVNADGLRVDQHGHPIAFDSVIPAQASTADWQAALTRGGVISVTPGTYTLGQLTLIGGTTIIGNGAIVKPESTFTGIFWDTGLATPTGPIVIDNLRFEGLSPTTNFNNVSYFSLFNDSIDPYYNANWINKTGLRISCGAGGSITNCHFYGWTGNGLLMINARDIAAYTARTVALSGNQFYHNFVGCFIAGANYHIAGYYNNGDFVTPQHSAEYTIATNNFAFRNYMGFCAPAGNCNISNNRITDNYVAMLVGSCNNAGHGVYSNNTVNHNVFGFCAESNNGGIYQGNAFLANTTHIRFKNITEMQVTGNWFGGGELVVTDTSTGFIKDNFYQGTWGGTFPVTLVAAIQVIGNKSTTVADSTDGSPGYLLLQDQKAANTHGGSYAGGVWVTRDLNTEVVDTIGSTLSSNTFTLPAGTYDIRGFTPMFAGGFARARLYNVTDTAVALYGMSVYNASGGQQNFPLIGRITITATKTFRVESYAQLAQADYGLGYAGNLAIEVYTQIEIRKVA